MSFINEHVVVAPSPQDEEWLACYDANNLYGEAMCSLLPCHNFTWVEPEELETIDWYNIDTEGKDLHNER